jgi:hypothetical protein
MNMPFGRSLTALSICLALSMVAAASEVVAAKHGNHTAAPLKLYGQIDELSMMCSAAGIKLTGNKLPAKVAKVSLGSAALYAGVRQDDLVLDAHPDGLQLVLTIDRKGKRYQTSVATDIHGLKEQFERRGIKWSLGDTAFDKELEEIGKCNLVVLLDRSESMADAHAGCPGNLTKWMWCKHQLDGLYFSTARLLDDGFDLVPFARTSERVNDVTLWDLKSLFNRLQPQGADKNISGALESVLDDRTRWHVKNDKPLIIVVLTDGMKNTGRPLENVLIESSRKIENPKGVSVVFLQVGESIVGDELFSDLDQNLVAKGATYKMVTYKPFTELRQKGLLNEVLQAVKQTLH